MILTMELIEKKVRLTLIIKLTNTDDEMNKYKGMFYFMTCKTCIIHIFGV